jgi:hypothetical protein
MSKYKIVCAACYLSPGLGGRSKNEKFCSFSQTCNGQCDECLVNRYTFFYICCNCKKKKNRYLVLHPNMPLEEIYKPPNDDEKK